MFKLIIIIIALLIIGCGSSEVAVIPWGEITDVQISDQETGYLIAIAPCTVTVKNRCTLIAKFKSSSTIYCANHPECESCYRDKDGSKASQLYEVDGDGTFYVGKNK